MKFCTRIAFSMNGFSNTLTYMYLAIGPDRPLDIAQIAWPAQQSCIILFWIDAKFTFGSEKNTFCRL